jgi:transcriptional regulator with XRE-family HTH domain
LVRSEPERRDSMSSISVPAFTRKLREVVADEPKAFAYDVGLSLSAVYNYLNGRVPATDVLFRIARYTGRPMEWFLVDENPSADVMSLGAEVAVPTAYAASPSGRGGT